MSTVLEKPKSISSRFLRLSTFAEIGTRRGPGRAVGRADHVRGGADHCSDLGAGLFTCRPT